MREPNRWTRRMKNKGRTSDAVAMFVFYIGGALLTIVAVFAAIVGLLYLAGDLGSGDTGSRVFGGLTIALSIAVFGIGAWLTRTYRVERR